MCRHGARPLWNIFRGICRAGRLTDRYVSTRWLKRGPVASSNHVQGAFVRIFIPPHHSLNPVSLVVFLCANFSVQSLFVQISISFCVSVTFLIISLTPLHVVPVTVSSCCCIIIPLSSCHLPLFFLLPSSRSSHFSPVTCFLSQYSPISPLLQYPLSHPIFYTWSVVPFPYLIRNPPWVLVTKQNIYCEQFSHGFLGHVRGTRD